jgi:hypothetical protein
MSFSHLLPVGDLGLPVGYRSCKSVIRETRDGRRKMFYENMERAWDRGLLKRNNTSKEMYENNLFENFFSSSTVRHVQGLLDNSNRPAIGDGVPEEI